MNAARTLHDRDSCPTIFDVFKTCGAPQAEGAGPKRFTVQRVHDSLRHHDCSREEDSASSG